MDGTIVSGRLLDEERSGWAMPCPACSREVRYTVLNVAAGFEPFMYCSRGSDFVLRDEDARLVAQSSAGALQPSVDRLRSVYDQMELVLDPCPGGGQFRRWSNVKCPHCQHEFPYNNGVKSEDVRYFESKVVWIEGAIAWRGASRPGNRLVAVLI
jgi:hypothetical protein